MTDTQITGRRKLVVHNDRNDDTGTPAYIGLWVDGVQVAAGVRQDDGYAERNGGARWSLWSSGLSLRTTSDAPISWEHPGAKQPMTAAPLPVADEHEIRAWLSLLGEIAEYGPRIVETRRHR